MLLTFDDQFLLTVAEDGCLFTWKVFDKDGRGIKREREVGFAEEVLVTKTDMEEKVRIRSNEEGRGRSLPDCVQTPGTDSQGPVCLTAPCAPRRLPRSLPFSSAHHHAALLPVAGSLSTLTPARHPAPWSS